MIKLWGRVNSINVSKVLWVLEEVGAPYTRSDGIDARGNHSGELLAANPNARVPVINDEGFVLWESNAIVRYISYKYGLGTIYPTDVRERAESEQWMEWQQTSISPPLALPFHGLIRRHPQHRDPASIERAGAELDRLWRILDAHLSERDYVLGYEFSMADISLGVAAWRWFNLPMKRADVPQVERWFETLKTRESYRKNVMRPLT